MTTSRDALDTKFFEEEYDTIAGLMIDRLGRLPAPGAQENIQYAGYLFTAEKVSEHRIVTILAHKLAEGETENAQTT